jgi:hypothetical protein
MDPARGLFLDQRWLELAPGLVPDATVLRDPGCNAGFWDVPNRPLTGGPDSYSVAGVPLRCFHLSGFDPDRPDELSAHQNRVDLAEHPLLAGLVRDYTRELHEAGYSEWLRANADRHPDLPAATAPVAIAIDGRELEPLLLALFRERAEPLAEFPRLARRAGPGGRGGRCDPLPL